MKNRFYYILILTGLLCLGCVTQDLTITYIGNEGFLIQKGQTKILCDALFGDIESDAYQIPSDSLLQRLRKAESPFDKIDLISISHSHQDHFNAEFTLEHLLNDPKTRCIAPAQAVDKLRDLPDFGSVASRIIRLDPPLYTDTTFNVKNITIRALRLAHSPYMEVDPQSGLEVDRHRNVQNLGYCFKINDTQIFHGGDANPSDSSEFVHFALQNEAIDLAFLDRLFLFRGETASVIMEKYIQAKHMIFMHISPANALRIAPFFIEDSSATVFTSPMEKLHLNF